MRYLDKRTQYLTDKVRKRLPKDKQDALDYIEEADDLVDDCRYIIYYTDEYSDGECTGSSYIVKTLSEAVEYIKNTLFRVK